MKKIILIILIFVLVSIPCFAEFETDTNGFVQIFADSERVVFAPEHQLLSPLNTNLFYNKGVVSIQLTIVPKTKNNLNNLHKVAQKFFTAQTDPGALKEIKGSVWDVEFIKDFKQMNIFKVSFIDVNGWPVVKGRFGESMDLTDKGNWLFAVVLKKLDAYYLKIKTESKPHERNLENVEV